MYKERAQLQNPDKSFRCHLTIAEAERRVKRGEMIRVSRVKADKPIYRMRNFPDPSDSKESSTTVTVSDMNAAVGLRKVNETWIERLIGLKLIPEGTSLTLEYLG